MGIIKRITVLTAALISSSLVFAADVKVVSVTGKCEYENNGAWVALQAGQTLDKGAKIQTGFKSQLVLSLTSNKENSTITVDQLSRMTINELYSSDSLDKTSVSMDTGSVKAEINKTSDNKVNFTISSPNATASVRGTVVNFKNIAGGVSVTTERGTVAVWAPKEGEEEAEAESEGEEESETESSSDSASGDSAASSSENAEVVIPKTASQVRENQAVSVSSSGSVKGTLETAAQKSTALTSISTAAEEEANSLTTVSTSTEAKVVQSAPTAIKASIDWD